MGAARAVAGVPTLHRQLLQQALRAEEWTTTRRAPTQTQFVDLELLITSYRKGLMADSLHTMRHRHCSHAWLHYTQLQAAAHPFTPHDGYLDPQRRTLHHTAQLDLAQCKTELSESLIRLYRCKTQAVTLIHGNCTRVDHRRKASQVLGYDASVRCLRHGCMVWIRHPARHK